MKSTLISGIIDFRIRKKIFEAYNIEIKHKNRRIYISRNKAPKRRLKNEIVVLLSSKRGIKIFG